MSDSERANSDTEISFSNASEESIASLPGSQRDTPGQTGSQQGRSESTERVVVTKRVVTTKNDQTELVSRVLSLEQDLQKIFSAISKYAGCQISTADQAIENISTLFETVSEKYGVNSIAGLLNFLEEKVRSERLPFLEAQAKIKELEAENEELRRKVADQSSSSTEELLSMVNRNRQEAETQIKLAEYETRIVELELELKELRSRERTEKDDVEPKSFDNLDTIEEAIDTFEVFTNTQGEVIQILTSQKTELTTAVGKLTKCLEAAEGVIKELREEREELISQTEELERQYEDQREHNAERLQTLLERVVDLLPPEITPIEGSIDDQIVKMVRDLVQMLEQSDSESKCSQKGKREEALLAQLDKAACFVRAFATSKLEFERSTFSEYERSRIVTEIARIQNFIGNEALELPLSASLFKNDSPEEQLKVLNDFISHDDLVTTPVREIFALFALVVDVNALLFKKNRELTERTGSKIARLEKQNEELQKSVDVNNEKIECCAVLMREITGDEEPDIVTLAYNVVKEFNQLAADSKENAKSIQSLTTALDQLEGQQGAATPGKMGKVKAKLQKYKQLFYAAKSERDELAAEAKKKIGEVIQQLKDSEEARPDEASAEQLSKKLRKYKKACKFYKRKAEELEREHEGQRPDLKAEIERLTETNKSLNEHIVLIRNSLNEQTQKYAKLKEENEDLKQQNATTIRTIRIRTDELQERYAQKVEELEALVGKQNEEIVRVTSERNECKAKFIESKAAAAKLRLSEKMLSIKLNRLNEQAQLQTTAIEGQLNAKLSTMKNEYDKKLEELQNQIQKSTNELTELTEDTFGIHVNMDARASLDAIVALVSDLLAQNYVKDSLDTRKKLNMKPNESLSMIIDGYNYQISERDETIEALQDSIEQQKKKTAELEDKCNDTDNVFREYNEWLEWGTSLFLVLKNVPPPSPDLMRFDLEESILASLGHRTIIKRLETLRTAKQFLLSRNAPLARVRTTRHPPTIRSLVLVSICMKRLLALNRSL